MEIYGIIFNVSTHAQGIMCGDVCQTEMSGRDDVIGKKNLVLVKIFRINLMLF